MTNDVIQILSAEWGIAEKELQTAIDASQSIRERIQRLPEDADSIDLHSLHSDVKKFILGEYNGP